MKLAFMLGDLEFAWKHGDVVAAVTFMILVVLNTVLILTRYYNTRTRVPADSEHFHLVLDIINVLYMMFGTFLMCFSDNLSVEVIYFATVMLMACINLPVGKRGKKGGETARNMARHTTGLPWEPHCPRPREMAHPSDTNHGCPSCRPAARKLRVLQSV